MSGGGQVSELYNALIQTDVIRLLRLAPFWQWALCISSCTISVSFKDAAASANMDIAS
jgi:hypothetical protein